MKYMKKSFEGMEPYYSELITDGIILNANESPYQPPKCVLDEFKKSIDISFNRYPDMAETELCTSIANVYNLPDKSWVSCGVGSDELLDVVFRATLEVGDCVVGFSPSFSMYKIFTELVGGKYIPVYGDSNNIFNIDDMIKAIKDNKPKLALVCTPNNPTGQFIEKEDLKKIVEAASSVNTLVCIDAAYIDFAKEDYTTYFALNYDNVICFKTFSKAMSLPSIRVGFAMANPENIKMIDAIKAPYSVTSLSQVMANIAVNHMNDYKEQINLLKTERDRLFNELKSLGIDVYPSNANFLYCLMDDKINKALLEHKIYIRNFKSGVYRISVGTVEENNALLEVIRNEIK